MPSPVRILDRSAAEVLAGNLASVEFYFPDDGRMAIRARYEDGSKKEVTFFESANILSGSGILAAIGSCIDEVVEMHKGGIKVFLSGEAESLVSRAVVNNSIVRQNIGSRWTDERAEYDGSRTLAYVLRLASRNLDSQ